MTTGLSLHIGLNSVSAQAYGGWSGDLRACEADARDMAAIATSRNFATELLLTRDATANAVLSRIARAASQLKAGDFFLITYSGHGGQVADANGDESDGLDETWCLFDRMVIDDELNNIYSKFAAGVRVLVLSDSCHSGTVIKQLQANGFDLSKSSAAQLATFSKAAFPPYHGDGEYRVKSAPIDITLGEYARRQDVYESLQWLSGAGRQPPPAASILLISGCQDNQTSLDGLNNGAFTAALKATWNNGAFAGNYRAFKESIARLLPPSQSPNYLVTGAENLKFENSNPFQI